MDHAHACNIIHRDLKPENVLLDEEDCPVITDFGLGRALDALTSRATGTGAHIGTIGYMAPEQMNHAGKADVRSDIFSLGRMLYEMLTGDPEMAQLLILRFTEWVMGKGWGFGYTDVIGDTCARLFRATRHAEIKGQLAAAALEVGVSHNRFHVMDVAAALISEISEEADALAVAHAIRPLDYRAIENRLTVWKLNPILQELFAENDSGAS